MTGLLDHAIERVRELADRDQDDIAASLLAALPEASLPALDDATRRAIAEGLAQLRRGEVATDAEIVALLGEAVE